MATKKQQRRRQKERRHEYEEVWVDAEGNELDYEPTEAEQRKGASKAPAKGKAQPARSRSGRAMREIKPPAWQRVIPAPLSLRTSCRSPGANCTSIPGPAVAVEPPLENSTRPSTTTNQAPSSTWWPPYCWPGSSLIRIARAWSAVASTSGCVFVTGTAV